MGSSSVRPMISHQVPWRVCGVCMRACGGGVSLSMTRFEITLTVSVESGQRGRPTSHFSLK